MCWTKGNGNGWFVIMFFLFRSLAIRILFSFKTSNYSMLMKTVHRDRNFLYIFMYRFKKWSCQKISGKENQHEQIFWYINIINFCSIRSLTNGLDLRIRDPIRPFTVTQMSDLYRKIISSVQGIRVTDRARELNSEFSVILNHVNESISKNGPRSLVTLLI